MIAIPFADYKRLYSDVERLQAEKERLREALREARGEIISLACTGTERIRDLGGECADAEKTYWPAVTKIDAALSARGEGK